jgi:hypothetical protein
MSYNWIFRYVDDILIIYKIETTNIHDVLAISSNVIPTMKFVMEEENYNKTRIFWTSPSPKKTKRYHSIHTGNQLQHTP